MDEPAEANSSPELSGPALRPGERLRRAREAAGMSLAQVASETRIPQRHLRLIEAGDFAGLPARTYAIGFSKSFAKAVGLDEDEIADAVRDEFATREPAPAPRATPFEPGDPARVPDSTIIWIATAAVVALLVVGYFGYSSMFAPAAELPSLLPEEQPTAHAAASPAPTAAPQAQDSGPVVFTALEQGVWVKFYDGNGTQLMQKQMALGETYSVPANVPAPQLWTARPDALKITVGGREIPRLATQQQIVKDVPVTAAALLARNVPTTPPTPLPTPTPTPTPTSARASAPVAAAPARATSSQPAARRQAPDRGPTGSAVDAVIGSAPTD